MDAQSFWLQILSRRSLVFTVQSPRGLPDYSQITSRYLPEHSETTPRLRACSPRGKIDQEGTRGQETDPLAKVKEGEGQDLDLGEE